MSKVDLVRIRREMYGAPTHKLHQFLLDMTEELALARAVVEAAGVFLSYHTFDALTGEHEPYIEDSDGGRLAAALAAYRAKVGGGQ